MDFELQTASDNVSSILNKWIDMVLKETP